ncbi:MAG: ATP-binding cassette domain-containing protein [Candidatus Kapabacteria bacterium]|nr:ATP-binding cassette domain-containing protein [Candidatus Kapabacteria bacterium]MCS7169114.1 ATP-binding cassette domain-containing protein [Candidatus Kapabacteria bacterium]MDW8225866.1 ATP-binding cassette domain-containing protein [Bacteroidota bacterium]
MSAIEAVDLTRTFRAPVKQEGLWGAVRSFFCRQYREHRAVQAVTFRVTEGEIVGLLGANGAGKTTLLKLLTGLLYPTAGMAHVLGYVPWERSDAFRRQIALVMGQRSQLWWDLPAADSFLLHRAMYRISKADFQRRRDSLSAMLGIADKLHIQVRRLSLGERMKCEILAALLHAPRVLFLDEPTLGLDVVAQQTVRDFLAAYNRETGTTIMLTSHYMADIERLCQRVIVLDRGYLLYDGDLRELARCYAAEKLVRVEFADTVRLEELLRIGSIHSSYDRTVVLRVPRGEAADRAAQLLSRFPVADVAIEEPPLEEVVCAIFRRSLLNSDEQPIGGTTDHTA